jgi:hypothetical protein
MNLQGNIEVADTAILPSIFSSCHVILICASLRLNTITYKDYISFESFLDAVHHKARTVVA